jgi:hypothetical protein
MRTGAYSLLAPACVQPLICETRRFGTEASGFEYYAFAC